MAHNFYFDSVINLCVTVFLHSPWGRPTSWSKYRWSLQCVLSSFVLDILFHEENIYTHWMLVGVLYIYIYIYNGVTHVWGCIEQSKLVGKFNGLDPAALLLTPLARYISTSYNEDSPDPGGIFSLSQNCKTNIAIQTCSASFHDYEHHKVWLSNTFSGVATLRGPDWKTWIW